MNSITSTAFYQLTDNAVIFRATKERETLRHNRIESDHAALKQRLRPMRGFRTLAGAKAALAGIETFRTIRKGQFENCETGVINEIDFVAKLFQDAA
ncbi:DDE-type integrase/transposase/recombinase [Nitratireductor aquimarinus]|uniref:DDE-type integrase/transposase/recombinase n=1 Tax=Nitratireductor aquimarinus TaxID=889300 RepID=UPI001A8E2772|nr:DDE-type integrase/transposase/recombinase [Nitratireductor aquimarinus]MBN8245660.1 DDE-type integrase/transposase/recombinase [Nitratireductor aquimarinus]MBY6134043.1 transposase [Nitratireductor aquimarinus]MCA1305139.1 transposase [Nitratireductor aquimarinus]